MSYMATVTHLKRFTPEERERILRAVGVATKAHEGQNRVFGGPYIIHPIAVGQALIDRYKADADVVIAGILHDTVEDTTLTLDDVEREFGATVRFLVDGVTDYGKGDGREHIELREERDERTHSKVHEYAQKDPRIYYIKIADRSDNMLTIPQFRPNSRLRLAKETLSFHVPICRKMGFEEQARWLEERCNAIIATTPHH